MFKEALEQHYGFLFEPPLMKEILAYGSLKKVAPGQQLIEIGEIISHMPLLLSGAIKIMREDDQGDELLLYFIEKGDTCAMSFSCCMGGTKSDIRAVAETDAEIIMVPVAQMEQWMAKYKTWQQFVLDSYHARMKELLHTVDHENRILLFFPLATKILQLARFCCLKFPSKRFSDQSCFQLPEKYS